MFADDAKLTLTITEAAQILGVSRSKMYELIHSRDFPCFRLGRRQLISRAGLAEWVSARTAAAIAEKGGQTA